MGGAKARTMGTGDVGLCRNLGERAGVREEAIAPLSPPGGGGAAPCGVEREPEK